MVKPVVKWVGGKTQILNTILDDFPKTMENYHETFLGGGSVLIGFLQRVKEGLIVVNGNIYASDLNPGLIGLFKNIQLDFMAVYDETMRLVDEYNSCATIKRSKKNTLKEDALNSKEDYYYWIRQTYNEMEDKFGVKASACFIFLNKTCFRGLFREGPHGFNVPYGNNKNPEIVNKENLEQLSVLIQEVRFSCCSYKHALDAVGHDDFVYMDPPYVEEKKGSFVTYTVDGFDHDSFFQSVETIPARFMLSNSNVEYVKEKMSRFNVKQIQCRRAIHSKNPGATTTETISTNY